MEHNEQEDPKKTNVTEKKVGRARAVSPDINPAVYLTATSARIKELEKSIRRDPGVLLFQTPEQILKFIDSQVEKKKLQFVRLPWRLISVGSYRVDKVPQFDAILTITKYGIVVTLPHAKDVNKSNRLCIPTSEMIDFKFHFGKMAPLMAVKTGTFYASWLRQTLGMDNGRQARLLGKAISDRFYCPLFGFLTQAWITVSIEKFTDSDISALRSMFPGTDHNKCFTFTVIHETSKLASHFDYITHM